MIRKLPVRKLLAGVAAAAMALPLLACSGGGGGSGSDWMKTGNRRGTYDGIICQSSISGATRFAPDGNKWKCQLGNDGYWAWYEYALQLTAMAAAADGATVSRTGVTAYPGSVFLLLNSQHLSTVEVTLDIETTLGLTRASDGTIKADPAAFAGPQQRLCSTNDKGVEECLGLTVRGTGPSTTVTIDADAGTAQVPMGFQIDIVALSGYTGLPAGCHLGPATGTLVANNYDATAGTATLVALDRPLSSASTCGDYNDDFTTALGLPGSMDIVLFTTIVLP